MMAESELFANFCQPCPANAAPYPSLTSRPGGRLTGLVISMPAAPGRALTGFLVTATAIDMLPSSSQHIRLLDHAQLLVHVHRPLGQLRRRELIEHVREDVVVVVGDAPPADVAIEVCPRVAILIVGPEPDDPAVVEPEGFRDPVGRDDGPRLDRT